MQKIPLMAAMADGTMEGRMTICKLCGDEIAGTGDGPSVFVLGYRIGPTVHQECLDRFNAEQAKRKPYRQPLEGAGRHFSHLPSQPEIRDWDNP